MKWGIAIIRGTATGASGSTSASGNAGNGGIAIGASSVVLQTVLQVLVMETDTAAV